ncbi:hypothetical protein L195_g049360 [Trifolium pratense]|uniref:Uncharacterized protein n=1 Tax=Trifolium pratense TaxID=57577 RepID=A0A2K3JNZ7_TRIPR|nr:hypothetical protein L195_g049360 [Trifolium pratense]
MTRNLYRISSFSQEAMHAVALILFVPILPTLSKKNRLRKASRDTPSCSFHQPKTFILGFSKGGTVLNQIVTELGFLGSGFNVNSAEEICIIPKTKEALLNSISEIHYVDVGLKSTGAYLTNHDTFERIAKRLMQGAHQICFVLHGTPRQWTDKQGRLRVLEALLKI